MSEFQSVYTTKSFSRERTNINRRYAMRTKTMEVLNLGLPRTGTSSIREALFILGYDDVYHMGTVMNENPPDAAIWVDAFRAKYEGKGKLFGRKEFDRVLGHCMAVCDYPPSAFGPELMDAYPEAKIIMSGRDNGKVWAKSVTDTIYEPYALVGPPTSFPDRVRKAFLGFFLPPLPFFDLMRLLYSYDFNGEFPQTGYQFYDLHRDEILAAAKSRGRPVLEFNAKQGWKPLCEFLGKPIPTGPDGKELPFPRVNDTANLKKDVDAFLTGHIVHYFWTNVIFKITGGIAVGALLFSGVRNRHALWEMTRQSIVRALLPGAQL